MTAACQASLSITNSQSLLKIMSIESVMPSSHQRTTSTVVPVSSHLQSFPASGSFWMSQFFTSGGQSIAVSASASALPMNTRDWFPLGWTGWISLQSIGLSRVLCNTTVQKHPFFFFFNFYFFISWRLITSQYCSGFCHTLTWISHGYTCIPHPDPPLPPPPPPDPSGSSQCTRPEHLSHASNLGWWSVSP